MLGIFRVGFGGVLLYDLLRRWPDAGLLWSSEGVLTAASLQRAPQATPQWSLFLHLTSAASVRLAFAGLAVIFLLYALGLFTRWMQVLALVGYASLNARNLFSEDGGTGTTILLLTWTLLLPLADRFSLDALRRDAAAPQLRQRWQERAGARLPLTTCAALGLLLQAAVIYWLNAQHKTGVTWRSGDAVHLVLWQHRVNTPLALWLAAHEPAWFSPLATRATLRVEAILPVLLLWPTHLRFTRSAAFVLAVLLHGGIAMCLTLGPFSYAMICLVGLAIPGELLDAVAARLRGRSRGGWRTARWRGLAVRALARRAWARRLELPGSRRWARHARVLREVALGYVLLVEGASVVSSNPAIRRPLRISSKPLLRGYKPYLRAFQRWSMFAPDAPTEDGTLVVDAVTAAGRHLDPFSGRPTDFEQIRRGLSPHSIALSDYLFAMQQDHNRRYRLDLARYVRAQPAPSGDRFVTLEAWWVSYRPPPRGQHEPGPLQRKLVWRTKLTR